MDTLEYNYSNQIWRPSPTAAHGNSFFHSVFGTRDRDDQPYLDNQAKFRHMYWSTFLTYYSNGEDMPSSLLNLLQSCFVANAKFQNKHVHDPNDYSNYIQDVADREYWVLVQEIPLLATLENIRIVLFKDNCTDLEVFEPNLEFLGNFPFRIINAVREVVICLAGKHFSRLTPYDESSPQVSKNVPIDAMRELQNRNKLKPTRNFTRKRIYKKNSGSAGIKGVLYQIDLLTMVLLNALTKVDDWCLSTENKKAGKFDDLVFECLPSGSAILLQAKNKKTKIITYDDLISTNPQNEFSLPKYFFSYQEVKSKFKVQNVVICTNAKLNTETFPKGVLSEQSPIRKSILHFTTHNTFYTFNGCILSDLKQNIEKYESDNSKKITISEGDIDEYLSYLQFFPNCLREEEKDSIIEETVSREQFSENLDSRAIAKYVHDKMEEWFKEEKGRYLTPVEAKAFFCDFRSSKYCENLKLYDIAFERNYFQLLLAAKQQNDKRDPKRIFHIIPAKEYILNVVKMYQALQKEHKDKTLFVSPEESIKVRMDIIDAFEVTCYEFLVIVCRNKIEENIVQGICDTVMEILKNFEGKSVILIAAEGNSLVAEIKNVNIDFYERIPDNITFRDLTTSIQEKFKQKRNINFQGNAMSLEELFAPLANNDLNKIVESDTIAKLAKDDQIQIGLELEQLDNYYIHRSFNRNGINIPEEKMCHSDVKSEEKVILISDSAGMGKSTVLTSLAIAIKKYNPHLWVVRFDLNNYTNIMKASVKQHAKSIGITQLLDSQERSKLKSEFEKKLFINRNRVVLMLDGVDEVCPSYTELVINLLKECLAQDNLAKIIITTRPHLCEELEQVLSVKSFTLEPFSEENQTDFLTKYWTEKLDLRDDIKKDKCEIYAKALIRKMSGWIDEDAENTFAGIPLQTRMLAEVFQEENQVSEEELRDWQGCKEFLSSDNKEPKLPKRINLIQLYEMFVDKKRDIFINVKSNPSGSTAAEEALTEKFIDCHQYHLSLAVELIFYSYEWEMFTCYKSFDCTYSFVKNYLLRAGIIQLLGGELHFIHRTFAEYFAAECLLIQLKDGYENKDFQEFFIDEALMREEFYVVRAFFDSFVQKELHNLPDETFEAYCATDYTSIVMANRNTYFHLFAMEGCGGILSFFIKCIDFEVTGDRELKEENCIHVNVTDLDCRTPLHEAASRGHLNVLKILVERGAEVNMVDANNVTALHVAVLGGYLDVAKFLLEEADANVTIKNTYGESVLQAAATVGHLKLVKYFYERRVDIVGEFSTALHAAAYRGHLEVVKFLVEEAGVDVNAQDINGCTALHAAAQEGHLDVVKFLVEQNCDINIINNESTTAFHAAIYRMCLDVVVFLIDHGADVTIRDENEETIIDILRLLKESGYLN